MVELIFSKSIPFAIAFAGALVLTLILVPLVREMNRALGMVDRPDRRRVNKVPVPRGGGIALFTGVVASYSIFCLISGRPPLQGRLCDGWTYWKLVAIAAGVVALGYADDKWSLPPKIKLAGQLAAAFICWWWTGLGLRGLWPHIPVWADCVLTVFWITGAINAFNLIDGLDGLASGIALIATLGMAGSLFIIDIPQAALFHFAFAGGLLGFLRYNYNPASVFLGDSGSMYIGFTLSTLPLLSLEADSFLVSAGVPMLAMGVPIFDTALAICRRSVRRIITIRENSGGDHSGEVMTADTDHLHHRILRAVGLNQRKAAWILYAATAAGVAFGLVAMCLRSRTGGLWLVAVAFAGALAFKNMARIELYDVGRLLNTMARDRRASSRRLARIAVPVFMLCDIAILVCAFFIVLPVECYAPTASAVRLGLLIRVFVLFASLACARIYSTVWARAMLSNFLRLAAACLLGALVGGAGLYFAPSIDTDGIISSSLAYALVSFAGVAGLRIVRPAIRDLFYAIDCSRMKGARNVSRVLVYGSGLRYRSFRRELVRSSSANTRMIVGLIDDDIFLRGHYIGGIRIEGTLLDAPRVIKRLNVDAVVIACVFSPQWMKIVMDTLAPTGVKITRFSLVEEEVAP